MQICLAIVESHQAYHWMDSLLADEPTTGASEINAAGCVHINNEASFVCVINDAACSPHTSPEESMIPLTQAREHGICVDDIAKRHQNVHRDPGLQSVKMEGEIFFSCSMSIIASGKFGSQPPKNGTLSQDKN